MTQTMAHLHSHTHFSLLDGVSKPADIAKRCADINVPAVAMTDHGVISAAVKFLSAMKDKGIKPILGLEAYICESDPTIRDQTNRRLSHLPILAKNLDGWRQLVALTSFTNKKENAYYNPRTDLKGLADFTKGNLIGFAGHPGSCLANVMFEDYKAAYAATNYDEAKSHVHPDWEKRLRRKAGELQDVFGKDNFFFEIQILDPENMPACLILARTLRWLGKKMGVKCVATADAHYPERWRAQDQRILLATALKTTLKAIQQRIDDAEDVTLGGFFKGDHFHIPSPEEMLVHHTPEELAMSLEIADMCESYDIRRQPMVPTFDCPDGLTPDAYITKLCRRAWQSKIYDRVPENKWNTYADRVRYELGVIKDAGLPSYFLMVQDYVNWARERMLVGPGRGSAAGCLVSYLLGITDIDPLPYNLSFERFYNAGRNAPGKISMPDIDCDFPVNSRKLVIRYLKEKYGHDHVAQIATFNSMKGKGALTDVLHAHSVDYDLVKRITANIPDEARITEELQEMRESGVDPSIIRYALENDPESYAEWCILKDDGTCEGEYGKYFEQAMRLEGTKRNISMHAAAVVIANEKLADIAPLVYDDGVEGYIACMEYVDLELMGQLKVDILGVAALDKLEGGANLLRYGDVER